MASLNEQPTAAELKARLREKPLSELTEEMKKLSDSSDCDVDLLCAYLDVLEEKAPVLPADYDPAKDYEAFRRSHARLFDLAEPEPEKAEPSAARKSGSLRLRQTLITFAAIFCLVIFVADANGAGVMDRLIEWGTETFTLRPASGVMELPTADENEFRSLQEALDFYGVEHAAIPTWIPGRFSIEKVTVFEANDIATIDGKYISGDDTLFIRGSISYDEDFTFEKDDMDGDYTICEINGIPFILSTNLEEERAVWTANGYVYSVSGNITEKELEKILDSVQIKE